MLLLEFEGASEASVQVKDMKYYLSSISIVPLYNTSYIHISLYAKEVPNLPEGPTLLPEFEGASEASVQVKDRTSYSTSYSFYNS